MEFKSESLQRSDSSAADTTLHKPMCSRLARQLYHGVICTVAPSYVAWAPEEYNKVGRHGQGEERATLNPRQLMPPLLPRLQGACVFRYQSWRSFVGRADSRRMPFTIQPSRKLVRLLLGVCPKALPADPHAVLVCRGTRLPQKVPHVYLSFR